MRRRTYGGDKHEANSTLKGIAVQVKKLEHDTRLWKEGIKMSAEEGMKLTSFGKAYDLFKSIVESCE